MVATDPIHPDSKRGQSLLKSRVLDTTKGIEVRAVAASRINDRPFLVQAMLREENNSVMTAIHYRIQHLRSMEEEAARERAEAWKRDHPFLDVMLRTSVSAVERLDNFVDRVFAPKRQPIDW